MTPRKAPGRRFSSSMWTEDAVAVLVMIVALAAGWASYETKLLLFGIENTSKGIEVIWKKETGE